MINIKIEITNSKIMAYLLLGASIMLDFSNDRSGSVFMFTVPFIAALIAGKQVTDYYKSKSHEKNQ